MSTEKARQLCCQGLWGSGERAGAHHLMVNLRSGKVRLVEKDEPGLALGLDILEEQCAWLLRDLTRAVEIARGPEALRAERFRQLEDRAGEAPPLARLLLPAVGRMAEMESRSVARLRCAAAALAAERFRRKHGRWPESLEEAAEEGYLRGCRPTRSMARCCAGGGRRTGW